MVQNDIVVALKYEKRHMYNIAEIQLSTGTHPSTDNSERNNLFHQTKNKPIFHSMPQWLLNFDPQQQQKQLKSDQILLNVVVELEF